MIATMEDFGGEIVIYRGGDGVKAQTLEKWRERIARHGFTLDATKEKGVCQD
jgi:hypothetical protein